MKGRERKKIKEKILFDILRNHALLQKYAGKVMGEKVIKKKHRSYHNITDFRRFNTFTFIETNFYEQLAKSRALKSIAET